MRFMVIVKANEESEAGKLPDEKMLVEMGKFNEQMMKAGVMLAGEGLQPSSKGVRIKFSGTKRTVVDGPFAATRELVAGYWLIQAKSRDEAIDWIRRAPFRNGEEVEIRQLFEEADFEPVLKTPAGKKAMADDAAFRKKHATRSSPNRASFRA